MEDLNNTPNLLVQNVNSEGAHHFYPLFGTMECSHLPTAVIAKVIMQSTKYNIDLHGIIYLQCNIM